MKMRLEFEDGTQPASPQRGRASLRCLHELPPIELAAIVYLHAWCQAGAPRDMIARDFRRVMGDADGAKAVADFNALMRNARRPILRHRLSQKCFGGDESAFANMIVAAAVQDGDDALLFAGALINSNAAWAVVGLALRLSQVFLRLARTPDLAHEPSYAAALTNYRH